MNRGSQPLAAGEAWAGKVQRSVDAGDVDAKGFVSWLGTRGVASMFWQAFCLAVVMRALLVGIVMYKGGCTLQEYSNAADGYQFKAVASAWLGHLGNVREQGFYEALAKSGGLESSHLVRFFSISSGILALGQFVGLSEGVAATVPFWLLAATAAGLASVWTGDRRSGLLLAALPPISLYTSSYLGSAGWLYSFAILGFGLIGRKLHFAAGLALGLASWARPEGFFPAIAVSFALIRSRDWRAAAVASSGAVLSLAVGVALVIARFEPLLVEIAAGSTGFLRIPTFLDLPGRGLWLGFTSMAGPWWKVPYVVLHLMVAAASLVILGRRARRAPDYRERIETTALTVWLALQVGLILLLRGSQGFDDLPRYAALAAPAMVAALLPWLPTRRWAISLACAGSFAIALIPAAKNARPECSGAGSGVSIAAATLDPSEISGDRTQARENDGLMRIRQQVDELVESRMVRDNDAEVILGSSPRLRVWRRATRAAGANGS